MPNCVPVSAQHQCRGSGITLVARELVRLAQLRMDMANNQIATTRKDDDARGASAAEEARKAVGAARAVRLGQVVRAAIRAASARAAHGDARYSE